MTICASLVVLSGFGDKVYAASALRGLRFFQETNASYYILFVEISVFWIRISTLKHRRGEAKLILVGS